MPKSEPLLDAALIGLKAFNFSLAVVDLLELLLMGKVRTQICLTKGLPFWSVAYLLT